MYGARPATIHDANAAIDIVDVLSEITATAEFQQAVRELNSHGTFRPRGHEHRIELVEPGDCCDRGGEGDPLQPCEWRCPFAAAGSRPCRPDRSPLRGRG